MFQLITSGMGATQHVCVLHRHVIDNDLFLQEFGKNDDITHADRLDGFPWIWIHFKKNAWEICFWKTSWYARGKMRTLTFMDQPFYDSCMYLCLQLACLVHMTYAVVCFPSHNPTRNYDQLWSANLVVSPQNFGCKNQFCFCVLNCCLTCLMFQSMFSYSGRMP